MMYLNRLRHSAHLRGTDRKTGTTFARKPGNFPQPVRGFTLVELLIVIGIIVVLIALLLPAVGMVRSRARSARCQSNLTEIGIALNKANGRMPEPLRASEWLTRLPQFLDDEQSLLVCPEDYETTAATSYGMNNRGHRLLGGDGTKIVVLDYHVPEAVAVVPSLAEQNWIDGRAPRHRGRINVLFHSGAVTSHEPVNIDPRLCRPFADYWRPQRDHDIVLEDCLLEGDNLTDGTGGTTDGGDSTDGGDGSGTDDGGDDGTDDPPECTTCTDPCGFPGGAFVHLRFDNPGDLGESAAGGGVTNHGVQWDANGRVGGAAYFDKVSGHWLGVPTSGMGTHRTGSVALWVKAESSSSNMTMFYGHFSNSTQGEGFGSNAEANFNLLPSGKLIGFVENRANNSGGDGDSRAYSCDDGVVGDGQWHHVAWTWNPGGDSVVYVDGCEAGRAAMQDSEMHTDPFHTVRIGRPNKTSYLGQWRTVHGWLDEIYLFSVELQPCEVAALYDAAGEP